MELVSFSWPSLLAFAVACVAIEVTPGPNMTYLAVVTLERGRRAGLAAVLGVCAGLLAIGLAAAFGLAAIIAESPTVYEALRWAGIAYMLRLAWEAWYDADDVQPIAKSNNRELLKLFRRGLITNLLNPKAALFYVAILPTFVVPSRALLGQTLSLTFVYVAIATSIHAVIVMVAGAAAPFFADPGRTRSLRQGLALVLLLVAVWMTFSTGRS